MTDNEKLLTELLNRFIKMCDTVKSNPNYNRIDLAETIQRLSIESLQNLK
jgi:hypothetical protein